MDDYNFRIDGGFGRPLTAVNGPPAREPLSPMPATPLELTVPTREKVHFLASAAAHGGVAPDVVETHMSWVFLAADRALKLKKPVRTDLLDFSTLDTRAFNCREEVRLNRRLAPEVYLGVVPLVRAPDGALAIGARPAAAPIDWLVEMRRLPADRMLDAAIRSGTVNRADIRRLGARLATFFRAAPRVALTAAAYLERFALLQAANRAVLLERAFGALAAGPLLDTADALRARHAEALGERAADGRVREGHGDLRPEHIVLDGTPVVIDCLEFNPALREVDPFDELAFLGLECRMLGAAWVEPVLHGCVAEALGESPPPVVQALYAAHRALLRARLSAAHLLDAQPRTPERWRPLAARYLAEARSALGAAR